jgi:hypothetical protein
MTSQTFTVGEYKHTPYGKKVRRKVPYINLGWLHLVEVVAQEDGKWKRRFHPGIFACLFEQVLYANRTEGLPAYEQVSTWSLKPRVATHIVADILKHKHRRQRQAKRYLQAMDRLGLLSVQFSHDEWTITFTDWYDWWAQHIGILEQGMVGIRPLSPVECRHLGYLSRYWNSKPWRLFLPNKQVLTYRPDGRINKTNGPGGVPDKRKVNHRRWCGYSWEVANEHFRAAESGGIDYHWKSLRPEIKKGLLKKKGLLEEKLLQSQIDRKVHAFERETKEGLKETRPGRETWAISNELAALLKRHSLATQKRRNAMGHITVKIPQAMRLGYPVDKEQLDRIMLAFDIRGIRRPRVVPQQDGGFQLQVDRPSKVRYRKGHENWEVRGEVPVELYVGNGPRRRPKTRCKQTKSKVQVFITDGDYKVRHQLNDPSYFDRKFVAVSEVKLEELPLDLKDPDLWDDLREAGLPFHKDYMRKVMRVTIRGSHHGPKVNQIHPLHIIQPCLCPKEQNKVNHTTRYNRAMSKRKRKAQEPDDRPLHEKPVTEMTDLEYHEWKANRPPPPDTCTPEEDAERARKWKRQGEHLRAIGSPKAFLYDDDAPPDSGFD